MAVIGPDVVALRSNPNYIPSLDGVRALAVLVVFSAHAGLPVIVNGSTGVTLFFFLSGFLITTLLRREHAREGRVRLADFYLRRAFRILPPLYVALILGILAVKLGIVQGDVSLLGVVSQVLHFSNYWIVFAGRDGISPTTLAMWSISVEEHFYLIFPLLYIWLAARSLKTQRFTVGLICIGILFWRVYVYEMSGGGFDRIYLSSDTRFDSILWGSMLALVWDPSKDRVPGSRTLWVWGITPVALAAFWTFQRLEAPAALTWSYTAQAWCLAILFISIVRYHDSVWGRLLNSKTVTRVGVLSYSIYLLHQLFLEVVHNATPLNTSVSAALSLVLTIFGALLMYRWVERPALDARRKLRSPTMKTSGT